MSQLVCQCGGIVPRPMPIKCPHCGRVIVSIRRPRGTYLWPMLVIGGFFSLMIAGLWLLLTWLDR